MGIYQIAIDGPSGSGKSTLAKGVAKELGIMYLDTGAMYRTCGLCALKKGIDPRNEDEVNAMLEDLNVEVKFEDGIQHMILNGEDVTDRLRTEAVGNMASASSGNAKVREKLVELQQKLAKKVPVVMDGRDIGTVVLPDAELKIYLTADVRTRAMRRYQELLEKQGAGEAAPVLEMIEQDIRERDERDMNRANSPLRKAEDAVLLDSSDLTPDEVTERILGLAAERA